MKIAVRVAVRVAVRHLPNVVCPRVRYHVNARDCLLRLVGLVV